MTNVKAAAHNAISVLSCQALFVLEFIIASPYCKRYLSSLKPVDL
jgi:hypothetical protein